MIEDFAGRIPESLKQKTGIAFFSGRHSFSKQSDLYILGINPGGEDPTDTPYTSLGSRIKEVLYNKKDDWAALKDDCWCGKCEGRLPCKHFLQRNLRHLIKQAGMNPRDVPVSEVVFRTSRGLATLDKPPDSLSKSDASFRHHPQGCVVKVHDSHQEHLLL